RGGRRSLPSRDAGRLHHDLVHSSLRQELPKEPFGHRGAADVSRAHDEDRAHLPRSLPSELQGRDWGASMARMAPRRSASEIGPGRRTLTRSASMAATVEEVPAGGGSPGGSTRYTATRSPNAERSASGFPCGASPDRLA